MNKITGQDLLNFEAYRKTDCLPLWEHKNYESSGLRYAKNGSMVVEEDLLYNLKELGYFQRKGNATTYTFEEAYTEWYEEANYVTFQLRVHKSKEEYAKFLIEEAERRLNSPFECIERARNKK